MRLNLFLPFSRQQGRWRVILTKLGPSWAQSPVRRLIQALSLGLFLVLLFYVSWPGEGPTTGTAVQDKEFVGAETFLAMDPLAGVSAAVAARTWLPSLIGVAAILAVCLFFPRGFCGYVCPLGTLIDVFDRLLGRRSGSSGAARRGVWVHLRYYVLAGILIAAAMGVLVSGFFAAIPLLARGLHFGLSPVQQGLLRHWHLVPPVSLGQILGVLPLLVVLAVGLLGRRFWCRCLCPTGALFSAAALGRLMERKVCDSCISCGACRKVCPFDAIKEDFTTRGPDCTFCQTCGGACPTGAIRFVSRRHTGSRKPAAARPAGEVSLSRRGFLAGAAGGVAVAAGAGRFLGRMLPGALRRPVVRPPGSLPEEKFLATCVRCGLCMKACPTGVLQPVAFRHGIDALWTPSARTDWSGCDPNCNNCGQVCPTGAIRALTLEEKSAARMGLAAVDEATCLPHAGVGQCRLCVDTCRSAGHEAIEFLRVHVELDENDLPVEDSGYLAPFVLADRCVGCGLCQSRCHAAHVRDSATLRQAAIVVEAGAGKEDRIVRGSYRALRQARQKAAGKSAGQDGSSGGYMPDFLTE